MAVCGDGRIRRIGRRQRRELLCAPHHHQIPATHAPASDDAHRAVPMKKKGKGRVKAPFRRKIRQRICLMTVWLLMPAHSLPSDHHDRSLLGEISFRPLSSYLARDAPAFVPPGLPKAGMAGAFAGIPFLPRTGGRQAGLEQQAPLQAGRKGVRAARLAGERGEGRKTLLGALVQGKQGGEGGKEEDGERDGGKRRDRGAQGFGMRRLPSKPAAPPRSVESMLGSPLVLSDRSAAVLRPQPPQRPTTAFKEDGEGMSWVQSNRPTEEEQGGELSLAEVLEGAELGRGVETEVNAAGEGEEVKAGGREHWAYEFGYKLSSNAVASVTKAIDYARSSLLKPSTGVTAHVEELSGVSEAIGEGGARREEEQEEGGRDQDAWEEGAWLFAEETLAERGEERKEGLQLELRGAEEEGRCACEEEQQLEEEEEIWEGGEDFVAVYGGSSHSTSVMSEDAEEEVEAALEHKLHLRNIETEPTAPEAAPPVVAPTSEHGLGGAAPSSGTGLGGGKEDAQVKRQRRRDELVEFVQKLAFWQSSYPQQTPTPPAPELPMGSLTLQREEGAGELEEAEVQELVEGLMQGMQQAAEGGELLGSSEEEQVAAQASLAMASSSSGSLAAAIAKTLNSLGLESEVYDRLLDETRRALLQSIGVVSGPMDAYYRPDDWAAYPQYDMKLAMLMSQYAFESYNDPVDGLWEQHMDGTRVAYLSAAFLPELYSGVLSVNLTRVSPRLPLGDDSKPCYVRLRLPHSVHRTSATKLRGGAEGNGGASDGWNETLRLFTSADPSDSLQVELVNVRSSFGFNADQVIASGSVPLSSLRREGRHKLTLKLSTPLVGQDSSPQAAEEEQDEEEQEAAQGKEGQERGMEMVATEEGVPAKSAAIANLMEEYVKQEADGGEAERRAGRGAQPWFLRGRDGAGNGTGEGEREALEQTLTAAGFEESKPLAGRKAVWTRGGRVAGEHLIEALGGDQVECWLEGVGLGRYCEAVRGEGIEGRGLLELYALHQVDSVGFYQTAKEQLRIERFGDVLALAQELQALVDAAALHEASRDTANSVLPYWSGYIEETEEGSGNGKAGSSWALWRLGELLAGTSRDQGEEEEQGAVKEPRGAGANKSGNEDWGRIELVTEYAAFESEGAGEQESEGERRDSVGGRRGKVEAAEEFRTSKLNNPQYMERWSVLSKLALQHGNGRLEASSLGEATCFIENNSTDTHVVFWRDPVHKRVVVSFRGTDINWKDFLTDLMCFQTDASFLFYSNTSQPPAASSAQSDAQPEPTEPDVQAQVGADPAGLGAFVEQTPTRPAPKAHIGFCIAYASVREHLFRQLETLIPQDERSEWTVYCTGHSLGAALATLLTIDVPMRLPGVEVGMYTFGAPKVGDAEFARLFNQQCPNAFRVVNDADVIVRLPRNSGFGAIPGSGSYFHVGRTVLTSPECAVWVEGESPGDDPLRDRWEHPSDLLDAEVQLMSTVVDGKSFRDHVEEGYYSAMLSMLQRTAPSVASKTGTGTPSPGPAEPVEAEPKAAAKEPVR